MVAGKRTGFHSALHGEAALVMVAGKRTGLHVGFDCHFLFLFFDLEQLCCPLPHRAQTNVEKYHEL
jgi:hypothetical protein